MAVVVARKGRVDTSADEAGDAGDVPADKVEK